MNAREPHTLIEDRLDRIRRFERFYERHFRQMHRRVAMEDFTLADTTVLHEMGIVEGAVSAAWLCDRLGLDSGYLARILKKLEACGLAMSNPAAGDRRMREWRLTRHGNDFARSIEREYRDRAREAFAKLPEEHQRRLVEAMANIEELLRRTSFQELFDPLPARQALVVIRRPG